MNCTFFDLMCMIDAGTLPREDILDVTYDLLQNNKILKKKRDKSIRIKGCDVTVVLSSRDGKLSL